MPVQINEMTISVEIEESPHPEPARPATSTGQNDLTKAIIRECIDSVMETLRNKNER